MSFDDLAYLKKRCANKRILYIEDDSNVRLQTRKLLEIYFEDITEASDGMLGLKAFKENSFDVIFTDIIMPNMDGIGFLKEIRAIDPNVPIVMFSACDDTEYFIKAIEFGVEGYLLKPFTFEEITATLKKIAHRFDTNREKTIFLEDGYVWYVKDKTLFKKNRVVKLSRHEIRFLELMTSFKNQIYSNYEIENFVFDDELSQNKRTRNLISRLRGKLKIKLVENIYAEGYRLKWSK